MPVRDIVCVSMLATLGCQGEDGIVFSIGVKASIMKSSMGTPALRSHVRCIGKGSAMTDSESGSDWQGF